MLSKKRISQLFTQIYLSMNIVSSNKFSNELNIDSKHYKAELRNKDIILNPIQKHENTLIFMHGLGDSAFGFLDIFTSNMTFVPQNTKVVLLNAPENPVSINGGLKMNSWYDIKQLGQDRSQFAFDEIFGRQEIDYNSQLIQKEMEKELSLLKSSKNLFIGGFSQGAVMALHNGLQWKYPIGGILALSGYLFEITQLNNLNNVPVFLYHGQDDQMIPFNLAKESYQKLMESKLVEFYSEKYLSHSISPSEMNAAKKFFLHHSQNNQNSDL